MSKNSKISAEEAKEVGENLESAGITLMSNNLDAAWLLSLEHGTIDPNTNVTNDDLVMTAKLPLPI